MNMSMMFMILIVGFCVWTLWNNSIKQKQILCTFRRVNKTKITKFVKMQQNYVIFDGGQYDIIPSRVSFQWYPVLFGLMHLWVATLDYTYGKRLPLDPNKMNYDWDNPQTRKAINKAETIQSYLKTSNPKANPKQDLITKYLPWAHNISPLISYLPIKIHNSYLDN